MKDANLHAQLSSPVQKFGPLSPSRKTKLLPDNRLISQGESRRAEIRRLPAARFYPRGPAFLCGEEAED